MYLSGYLLANSYNNYANRNYFSFLKKRFLRIYPSLHIALLFIISIYIFTGINFSFFEVLLSFAGLQYFFGIAPFGPQMWFISVILICYILCIPTIFILKNKPFYFYITILSIFIIIYCINPEIFSDLYNKVNDKCIYRIFYHYIIFSLGICLSIYKIEIDFLNFWPALHLFFIAFFIRLILYLFPYLGLIRILINVLLAFSLITLIASTFNFFVTSMPEIFNISSITYEIYLIHVAVIYLLKYADPGKFYTYPLVFIITIPMAFIISNLSLYYAQYIGYFDTTMDKMSRLVSSRD
jgi:peptidoglycan/LPS O-acetylase OafA/YrhL